MVKSFATGSVTGYVDGFGNDGIDVGGLIGYNNGAVANAYAMGAVIGGDQLGGLVGANVGSLSSVYSTGLVQAAVGATPTEIGGLIGEDDSGEIQFAYWDTLTSGQPTVGVGAFGTPGEVTGFTTADLQSTATVGVALGAAFAGGAAGGQNGVYPYLVDFFPNGVQAVSGFAYSDAAVTPLVAATVGVIANGVSLGTTTTGANGYYYFLTAAGGVPSGQSVLAYNNSPDAATLATSTGAVNTSVNLYGDALSGTSSDTSFSQLVTDFIPQLAAATGGNSQAASAILNANGLYLIATGPSFTLDEPFTASATDSMLVIQTTAANAPITIAQPITIEGSNELQLNASGSLTIDAAISITGAGTVTLTAAGENDGGSTLNPFLTFAQGDGISFAAGGGEGIAGPGPHDRRGELHPTLLDERRGRDQQRHGLLCPGPEPERFVHRLHRGCGRQLLRQARGPRQYDHRAHHQQRRQLRRTFRQAQLRRHRARYRPQRRLDHRVRRRRRAGRLQRGQRQDHRRHRRRGHRERRRRRECRRPGGLQPRDHRRLLPAQRVDNNASGHATGGLVGFNGVSASITASSASGDHQRRLALRPALPGVSPGFDDGAIRRRPGRYNAARGDQWRRRRDVTGGAYYTGGLVGYNAAGGTITAASASGTVHGGAHYIGGLAGYNGGAISTRRPRGDVTAAGGVYVGGLVGCNAAGTIATATTSGGA